MATLTKKQDYLAKDMDEETLNYCISEAKKLERDNPWTQEDTDQNAEYGTDYECWLDLVLDQTRKEIEWHRGQYCREMAE